MRLDILLFKSIKLKCLPMPWVQRENSSKQSDSYWLWLLDGSFHFSMYLFYLFKPKASYTLSKVPA